MLLLNLILYVIFLVLFVFWVWIWFILMGVGLFFVIDVLYIFCENNGGLLFELEIWIVNFVVMFRGGVVVLLYVIVIIWIDFFFLFRDLFNIILYLVLLLYFFNEKLLLFIVYFIWLLGFELGFLIDIKVKMVFIVVFLNILRLFFLFGKIFKMIWGVVFCVFNMVMKMGICDIKGFDVLLFVFIIIL